MSLKNTFSVYAQKKKQIDKDFVSKLITREPKNTLVEYIRENYFPLLYYLVDRSLGTKFKEKDREDKIADLVKDTIELVINNINDNKLKFEGQSAFSTYLMGIARTKLKESSRPYFPSDILREGEIGKDIYFHLIVIEEDIQVVRYFAVDKYEISNYEFSRLADLCLNHYTSHQNRIMKKNPLNRSRSYDAYLESESSRFEPGESPSVEDEFTQNMERDDKRRKEQYLIEFLKKLSPTEQALVQARILDDPPLPLKEIGEKLGLKNASYDMKKTMEKLRGALE